MKTSVIALVITGICLAQDSLDDLIADLGDSDPYVRSLAAQGLVKRTDSKTVTMLAKLLETGKSGTRIEAATILGQMGERAQPAAAQLADAARTGAAALVPIALTALIQSGAPNASEVVVELLSSKREPQVRASLAVVPKLADATSQAVTGIGELLRAAPTREIEELALSTLRQLGTRASAAVPYLTEELANRQRDILRALRTHSSKSTEFQDALASPRASSRRGYAKALDSIGGLSLKSLVELMRHAQIEGQLLTRELETPTSLAKSPDLVMRVLLEQRAEFGAGSNDWIHRLVRALGVRADDAWLAKTRQGPTEQRVSAIKLLEVMGPDAAPAIPVLVALLSDRSAPVRRAASDVLGSMGAVAVQSVPALVALLQDPERRSQLWAARALGQILGQSRKVGSSRSVLAERLLAGKSSHGRAVRAGLEWLALHQDKDGRWDCDDFHKHDPKQGVRDQGDEGQALYDVGVTGLATLAFLAAGYTDKGSKSSNPYASNVRRALRYFIRQQDEDGCVGSRASQHFMYNHGIAALALCDAAQLTRDPAYGAAAQNAVDFTLMARNPYLAWRYEPRGGENDSSVTGWMVVTLACAKQAGLKVDPSGLNGARMWFDKMTDPDSGRVGYNVSGGRPARPAGGQDRFPVKYSESMTAVGVLSRILCGEDPKNSAAIVQGVSRCLACRPKWSPSNGTIDMYYWYYGSAAMFHVGGKAWTKWRSALFTAALRGQRKSGHDRGSWDPVGPWGNDGGRVYSTAMMTLSLLTEVRFGTSSPSDGSGTSAKVRAVARAALKEAAKSTDATLAAAASSSLAIIFGENR